jgi:hypothetical protein
MSFVIPILSIQAMLLELDRDSRVLELKEFCRNNIEKEFKFKITNDLERQWFPVVITDSVWLATKIMKKYIK